MLIQDLKQEVFNYFEVPCVQISPQLLIDLICLVTAWHLNQHEPYEVTGYNQERLEIQVLTDCMHIFRTQKDKERVQKLLQKDFKNGTEL